MSVDDAIRESSLKVRPRKEIRAVGYVDAFRIILKLYGQINPNNSYSGFVQATLYSLRDDSIEGSNLKIFFDENQAREYFEEQRKEHNLQINDDPFRWLAESRK